MLLVHKSVIDTLSLTSRRLLLASSQPTISGYRKKNISDSSSSFN